MPYIVKAHAKKKGNYNNSITASIQIFGCLYKWKFITEAVHIASGENKYQTYTIKHY